MNKLKILKISLGELSGKSFYIIDFPDVYMSFNMAIQIDMNLFTKYLKILKEKDTKWALLNIRSNFKSDRDVAEFIIKNKYYELEILI